MKQAVLFDFDGTLLDSIADIAECGNEALAVAGLPKYEVAEYRNFVGNGVDVLIHNMLKNVDFARYGAPVKEKYMELYGDVCNRGCKTFPGILEMLEDLKKAGFLRAGITNKPDSMAQSTWKYTFGNRLDFVVGQRDDLPKKPDPAMAFEALKKLDADCIAFVGDSDVDIKTGKNGGFYTVGVSWGNQTIEQLHSCNADAIANTPEELKNILISMLRA